MHVFAGLFGTAERAVPAGRPHREAGARSTCEIRGRARDRPEGRGCHVRVPQPSACQHALVARPHVGYDPRKRPRRASRVLSDCRRGRDEQPLGQREDVRRPEHRWSWTVHARMIHHRSARDLHASRLRGHRFTIVHRSDQRPVDRRVRVRVAARPDRPDHGFIKPARLRSVMHRPWEAVRCDVDFADERLSGSQAPCGSFWQLYALGWQFQPHTLISGSRYTTMTRPSHHPDSGAQGLAQSIPALWISRAPLRSDRLRSRTAGTRPAILAGSAPASTVLNGRTSEMMVIADGRDVTTAGSGSRKARRCASTRRSPTCAQRRCSRKPYGS
jgi:hypothetical protein